MHKSYSSIFFDRGSTYKEFSLPIWKILDSLGLYSGHKNGCKEFQISGTASGIRLALDHLIAGTMWFISCRGQVVPASWRCNKGIVAGSLSVQKAILFRYGTQAMHPAGKCRIIMCIVLIIRLTSKETPVPLVPYCYGFCKANMVGHWIK